MRQPNVDEFLASLPAGTVEGWWEYYKLEPWDGWEPASMIAAEILNGLLDVAAGFGGEGAEPPEMIPHDAFVPYRKHVDKEQERLRASLKALEDMRGI